jgi:hypothetical protein
VEVARRLDKHCPLYVALDPAKTKPFESLEITQSQYIFNWLDQEVIASVSPLVLPVAELAQGWSLVEDGLGSDGVICVFSRLDRHACVEHLRRLARHQPRDLRNSAAGTLACFWPSILTVLLRYGEPGFAACLFDGVDAALVESDAEAGWSIYAPGDYRQTLLRMGFQWSDEPEAQA